MNEMKLSPTTALVCTTNRMLDETLLNKCFVMLRKSQSPLAKKLPFQKTNTSRKLHVRFVRAMDLT